MNQKPDDGVADEPRSVAAVYEDGAIAQTYLDKRTQFSWQRLLHRRQVAALNAAIAAHRPANVLEVAPGPARLSVELRGIRMGIMLENSEQMIAIARQRLARAGLSGAWRVVGGNAFEMTKVLEAATFDFAFTFRFIRHFHEPERRQLYEELRTCLRPGGVLMFDVVNAISRERVEAKHGRRPSGEIAIYDAGYDAESIAAEMRNSGFELLALTPILRHFALQSLLSYKLDDVAPRLVAPLIAVLEHIPSNTPLEWVISCRRS